MKKLSLVGLIVMITLFASSQSYNILDYAAISDGKTINTKTIQEAIDACASAGGGTVTVPPGVFLTGTLILKSDVNLYLDAGAVLKGSSDIKDYLVYNSPHADYPSYYGIIYAHKAENVSITGQGAINGNEEAFFVWDKAKSIEWGGTRFTRQKDKFRTVASGIGDGPVVPKERPRQMVIFSECRNVLVRDVMILKAPFWSLHFADCNGVVASGLKIWTSLETPNSDGIDITSCSNVTISDCDIRTGDDAIAITGYAYHEEIPGFNDLFHSSENILITNCNLQSRSSGIRIGYLDHNSIRNILISNVNITNSNRGIGIFVRHEGSIENVTITGVNIETRLHTGDWWGNGEPIHISAVPGKPGSNLGKIQRVTFRDITCRSENGILVYGSEESVIADLRFENLHFELVNSELNEVAGGNVDLRGAFLEAQLFESDISAFYARYVNGLSVEDADIFWGNVSEPYFTRGIHLSNVSDIRISETRTTASPSNPEIPAVLFENVKGLKTDLSNEDFESIFK